MKEMTLKNNKLFIQCFEEEVRVRSSDVFVSGKKRETGLQKRLSPLDSDAVGEPPDFSITYQRLKTGAL